jgi:hypothetical protein
MLGVEQYKMLKHTFVEVLSIKDVESINKIYIRFYGNKSAFPYERKFVKKIEVVI